MKYELSQQSTARSTLIYCRVDSGLLIWVAAFCTFTVDLVCGPHICLPYGLVIHVRVLVLKYCR